ncbi:bnk [Drosophila busckii]|uniref:Bnk n=1 Tax=Drosophila busckii TaxID=30019 RepID=A0A0M3QYP3_DROBS|nr:protein bottleneck [Drosophila busckii]ALC48033.1 bnk [Drosophila busckii]
MSISTFNFQFYNYKLPVGMPNMATSFSELEMDIDEELGMPTISSTPHPKAATPRYTSELSLPITQKPQLEALRPKLHTPHKRWSMELREKCLEMSKRNNGSDEEDQGGANAKLQQRFMQQLQQQPEADNLTAATEQPGSAVRSVSDKINFFNKLTNTYESAVACNTQASGNSNGNSNRFISLLRSSRPLNVATAQMPPPKPKRLGATTGTSMAEAMPHQFATPSAKTPPANNSTLQRKNSTLRRKPSMEKSRATIARQNSNAALRPQRHAMMEDLSLVVPVRLRIAEYEQRISMSA